MKKVINRVNRVTTLGVVAVSIMNMGASAFEAKSIEDITNEASNINSSYDSQNNSLSDSSVKNIQVTTSSAVETDVNNNDDTNKESASNNMGEILQTTTQAAVVVNNKLSPLVITEILPDSSNVSGADGYEFIEIYNNSSEDISLKDYKLYYNYPDNGDGSDVLWESVPSDVEIESGKTLVFWIKNGKNDNLTDADFNKKFGTNLVMGTDLVEIHSAGMANGSPRGIKLTTNTKELLDYVTYNMDGSNDVVTDKSIQYQYDINTGKSIMNSNNAKPTPGSVGDNEKPIKSVDLGECKNKPILSDMTESSFSNDKDFTFSVKAEEGDRSIKTVKLYLKDNTMKQYDVYNLTDGIESVFNKTIAAVDLSSKDSYTYYFEVCDGVNTVTTSEKTITTKMPSQKGLELNVYDNQIISGTQELVTGSAEDSNNNLKLFVDGKDVTNETIPSLEKAPVIAFDVSQTDVFFKNAVAVGNDLIGVFDDGTYSDWATIKYDVPVKYFEKGNDTTISIHAGNKANPLEHNEENNDDFIIKNIRLILPDGKTIRPEGYKDPEEVIKMGDSSGTIEILNAKFNIDYDSYKGIRYNWNTSSVKDGNHNILSVCGGSTTSAQVIVDNTPPDIVTNMENKNYKGDFTINASTSDKTTQVSKFNATLDDKDIEIPFKASSSSLTAGQHILKITAVDTAGNIGEKTVEFTTPEENPNVPNITAPVDGATINNDPVLSIVANDPTNDNMKVTFKTGDHYKLGDKEITSESGISQISGTTTAEAIANGYPYESYNIDLKENTADDNIAGISWNGQANPESKVSLYAYSTKYNKWNLIKTVTTDKDGAVAINAEIPVGEYRNNNEIKIMIQNGLGYTPTQYAPGTPANPTSNTEITTHNSEDIDRNKYDFTFALQSDTQYYNENLTNIFRHQININDWLIANRPRMNIQYMFHDGDIVDDFDQTYEWQNADDAYKKLDEAKFPYGVLAGNHDVGHKADDYSMYDNYFGENRFKDNPWYGEGYKNNRGHYDLISVDGIDFIIVYMGWEIGDEEIKWLNEVLAKYPERKAILNFHEYLLASGGFGEQPKRIHDEVVAVNPNVCMVLSGHYHSAETRIDQFDDNHDGVMDRSVYQMLFDYQDLPEGGRGFMRLMHFSLANNNITVRTYSPSEDSYSSGAFTPEQESFTIPFDKIGIKPNPKTLNTKSLSADIYSNNVIGTVDNVKSGDTASITWKNSNGKDYGWYAEITDSYGGIRRTPVYYVNINKISDTNPAAGMAADIEGREVVGNLLGGKLLTQSGGDMLASHDVTYKWYRLSNKDSGDGLLVGENETYKLVEDDRWKYIKLVITYNGQNFQDITGIITKESSNHHSKSSSSDNLESSSNNNNIPTGNELKVSNNIEVKKNQDGTIALLNDNGSPAVGWQKVNEKWYFADSEGIAKTGWQKINNVWYLFSDNGVMMTGWQKISDCWYLLKDDGAMATGWQKVNDGWYLFNANGVMATGWQEVNGSWYLFKDDGTMVTGWQEVNGSWYLFKDDGAMATGWQKINDNWYYLYPDGSMASNTIVDGYIIDADGSML